jgi:hypothetical protein
MPATAAADYGAARDPVFSRSFPLHDGDQRRIVRDRDAVIRMVSGRDKAAVESV